LGIVFGISGSTYKDEITTLYSYTDNLFVFRLAHAQNNGRGIYLNSENFLRHKITLASKHTRIKLHEILNKEVVVIKTKDSTYTYFKNSILVIKITKEIALDFIMVKFTPL